MPANGEDRRKSPRGHAIEDTALLQTSISSFLWEREACRALNAAGCALPWGCLFCAPTAALAWIARGHCGMAPACPPRRRSQYKPCSLLSKAQLLSRRLQRAVGCSSGCGRVVAADSVVRLASRQLPHNITVKILLSVGLGDYCRGYGHGDLW